MNSNWDQARERSQYHFDTRVIDSRWDCVISLGRVDLDWHRIVQELASTVAPATWATRGYQKQQGSVPGSELEGEEYDLERSGMSRDLAISHLGWHLTPELKQLSDSFGLSDCMARIHCQKPGELWNLHIDKLYKWNPDDPSSVQRIFIQMTDWQPGQFWQFGNYNYSHWRAGDVFTFDWQNVPHCTANAGYHDRYTLQLTGVRTPQTLTRLAELALS